MIEIYIALAVLVTIALVFAVVVKPDKKTSHSSYLSTQILKERKLL